MFAPINRFPNHHGYGEVRLSRFFALYLAQFGWLLLGLYLYSTAFWPSSCVNDSLIAVYACSIHLPENGGWHEASLLTWLWSTPLLILLELSRRLAPRPR